ncbi:hypothetical protein N7452_005693 [Penicillium brevicompactum]|uniref:Uncharacterized protein n=1 Tax=Penicillium brevicompactum TaxID=5074 RepID=A0A9W9QKB8_PENBR|nr:hypothetical protein N7452_005693 [Penicillium brevicompactum]
MAWFPLNVEKEKSWSFDIVGLLAVVGGSATQKYAHVITASPFGVIPRLLPAPETLLNPDRPTRLPSFKDATVYGVQGGYRVDEVNFFANVIHQIGSLKEYEFQSFHIEHKEEVVEQIRRENESLEQGAPRGGLVDVEMGNNTDQNRPQKPKSEMRKVFVELKPFSMLNMVTLASILMTIGLFVWAGVQHEAVAFLGLGTMSLSTCMACMSARWRPILSIRKAKLVIPRGDVVIRTRSGAFVVVTCTEEVARELYTGAETCDYVFNGWIHQCLLGSSTIFLMAAIIFFSNCSWEIQIAVGLAYIILNFMYWAMALLAQPEDMWDMKCRFIVKKHKGKSVQTENFTEVLWEAIKATKSIDWIKMHKIAPNTKQWEGWLAEARKINDKLEDNKHWDPVRAKDLWMKKRPKEAESDLAELERAWDAGEGYSHESKAGDSGNE